jgi:hypothetical protein
VRRHGIKLLICIINDGGYGAETHKFRAHGGDPMHATHGRGDLAQIARGFGLSGTRVTSLGQFDGLFGEPPDTGWRLSVGRACRRFDPVAQLTSGPLRRSIRRLAGGAARLQEAPPFA